MIKLHVVLYMTVLLVSIFVLHACKATQVQQKPAGVDKIATSMLGKAYEVNYNTSKTLALCYQKRQGDHINRKFKFIVVQIADNKIIKQGTYQLGYVKWVDDHTLEVASASTNQAASDKKLIDINIHEQ